MLGFRRIGEHENEVASVYAVIAVQMGYLSLSGEDRLNRLLDAHEFGSLESQCREILESENCIPEDVISRLGVPSIRWGTNDNYPCTLLYLCESDQTRYVHFDFWAEWYKNEEGIHIPASTAPNRYSEIFEFPPKRFRMSSCSPVWQRTAGGSRKDPHREEARMPFWIQGWMEVTTDKPDAADAIWQGVMDLGVLIDTSDAFPKCCSG